MTDFRRLRNEFARRVARWSAEAAYRGLSGRMIFAVTQTQGVALG
jgi:hypothetical protein